MELKLSNLSKPDHKRWKLIADYLLYTGLPTINAFFLFLEAKQLVPANFALWGVIVSNTLISLFKGTTKFTTNE